MLKRLAFVSVFGLASCGESSPPTSPDAMPDGAMAPDAPDARTDLCTGPGVRRGNGLAGFAPFTRSQARWATTMATQSGETGRAPYPPLEAADDPVVASFVAEYRTAYQSVLPRRGRLPFGVPPSSVPSDAAFLRARSSLVLAGDDASSLLRLTDVSTGRVGRYAAACDTFLAAWTDPQVAPLRELCNALGTPVRADDVADLKVDAIRILRGKECALPSAAYGALPVDSSSTAPFRISWPDFSQRAASVQQPCVGAFVHVAARGASGNALGTGWLFTKAVADLGTVPFPYTERDPVNGATTGSDGAPRGEFVSTRQIFDHGVSLYTGTSPIWLVTRDVFEQPFEQLVAHFDAGAPACDLTQSAPATPCIVPVQQPFLFPTAPLGLWLRQALDGTAAGFQPRAALDRNPSELQRDHAMFGTLLGQALRELDAIDIAGLSADARADLAERLGAVFHAYRLYQGRVNDIARFRLAVVELDSRYGLVVPDQGYLDLGSPTPELYQRLASADLDASLPITTPNCGPDAFTFHDLAAR